MLSLFFTDTSQATNFVQSTASSQEQLQALLHAMPQHGVYLAHPLPYYAIEGKAGYCPGLLAVVKTCNIMWNIVIDSNAKKTTEAMAIADDVGSLNYSIEDCDDAT